MWAICPNFSVKTLILGGEGTRACYSKKKITHEILAILFLFNGLNGFNTGLIVLHPPS